MKSDNPMNILMLDRYLTIGGVATYLKTLCNGLVERGHTVYIMTPADKDNRKLIDDFSSLGIQFLTVPNSKNRFTTFYRFVKMLYQFLKKKNIDIIHSHHRMVNFAGTLVSKLADVPHLITLHVFKKDHKILTKLWRNELITVPSKALKHHLVNSYNLKGKGIKVIYNAIENDYDVNEQIKASLERIFFDDSNTFYVVFIGRITHEKGVDVLLESIPKVRENYPEVEFRIFGDGPELPKLKKQCRALNLNPDKIFCGTTYQINEVLSLLNLCVIPSRSESFCLLALECMRAKKPVVASNVGGIPEVIINGKSGLLIEPEDSKILSEQIIRLYKNKRLREELADSGHRRFEKKFSLEKFYEDYLDTYQQLIKMS